MSRRSRRAAPPVAPPRRRRAQRGPCAVSLAFLCGLTAAILACDSPPPAPPAGIDAVASGGPERAGAAADAETAPPDAAVADPPGAAAELSYTPAEPPDAAAELSYTPAEPPDAGAAMSYAAAAALDGGSLDAAAAPDAAAAALDGGSPDAVAEALDGGAPDAGLPGSSEGCPDDMVLVEGDYCPVVDQICLKHHKEYEKDQERRATPYKEAEGPTSVSERCLEYRRPSECLSKKRAPMRFCVDRYEWPNRKGELPALLVSWRQAVKACEGVGKRLCTEDEFNFACEGEEMLPYTYGFVRDATKCNIDRPFRQREVTLYHYERCMRHPKCKAELERLDQRVPAGSMPACVSPFGAYDLNGNINEWVVRPGRKSPERSGLKGGWWGPMRGRCRPTVGFHKEEDYGYEQGFRCCKDAAAR
ncbi:formylglycine-generating enzyme family protein [Sorangium sp. So ce145]|uniref:formylglycine-generating enzyme family protein n=1 Tax=Sorangium sp. So ce145 TaxID=3133285 RepID=UPI003F605678